MCLQFFRHRESRSRICQSAHYTRILLLHTIPLLTWSQISSSPVCPGLQDGRSGYTVQYCCQHIRPDICWHFATYTKLKLSFGTHWNLPQSYLSDRGPNCDVLSGTNFILSFCLFSADVLLASSVLDLYDKPAPSSAEICFKQATLSTLYIFIIANFKDCGTSLLQFLLSTAFVVLGHLVHISSSIRK